MMSEARTTGVSQLILHLFCGARVGRDHLDIGHVERRPMAGENVIGSPHCRAVPNLIL